MSSDYNLKVINPQLVEEWHPTKNEGLIPLLSHLDLEKAYGGSVGFVDIHGRQKPIIEMEKIEDARNAMQGILALSMNNAFYFI